MKHQHKYDANGKQLCCTLEEKINHQTNKQTNKQVVLFTMIQKIILMMFINSKSKEMSAED